MKNKYILTLLIVFLIIVFFALYMIEIPVPSKTFTEEIELITK